MPHDEFFAIDTAAQPWDERYNPKLGKVIFRKDLYTDPETGAEIRLVRYPAGLVNPAHTHPCGHGLYVLEGDLVTHVPAPVDLVRRLEHRARLFGHARDAVERAPARELHCTCPTLGSKCCALEERRWNSLDCERDKRGIAPM